MIRHTTVARINHWITGGCFVLLLLSGLSMFHPMLYFLSSLFGGGQWTRAVHPWIGTVLLVSYAGLIVQFWRDNQWSRDDIAWMKAIDRVLANEEEGVPEVPRFNAGQKFVFWSMALLVPVLFFTGLVIWEVYFSTYTTDRAAADRRPDPQLGRHRGDHRLDHPCLRRDLGQGLDAGHDPGRGDAGLGLAASPQMAAPSGGGRFARADGGSAMRQGEVAPRGKWIGQAQGGVNAPDPLILPDPATSFADTAAGSTPCLPDIRWRTGCASWRGLPRAQHAPPPARAAARGSFRR